MEFAGRYALPVGAILLTLVVLSSQQSCSMSARSWAAMSLPVLSESDVTEGSASAEDSNDFTVPLPTPEELTRTLATRTAWQVWHGALQTIEPAAPAPGQCADSTLLRESTPRRHRLPPRNGESPSVLLVGSSTIAWALRSSFENASSESGWTLYNGAQPSTGISRPDYVNWPARLQRLTRDHEPDLVVMQFGGNDCQALHTAEGEVEAMRRPAHRWRDGYTERILHMISLARASGTAVLVADLQPGRSENHNRCLAEISKLVHRVALAADVPVFSVYRASADTHNRYTEMQVVHGQTQVIRSSDGLHLNRAGGEMVGQQLIRRIRQPDLLGGFHQDVCVTISAPRTGVDAPP
jgi:lysophospholipase L1-like esterase